MKIKASTYLPALFLAGSLALSSCFSDDTTLGSNPLSEITVIDGSISSVYNIDKNETLRIKPQISQTNAQKDVTYTWEIDLKEYSHDEEFVYPCRDLGTFHCRLIVENSDGKTFFPFTLNVNSPYEEGIAVLSQDSEGKSMLSFMLTPTDGSERHFTTSDCFAANNEDIPFASHAIDMAQSSNSLMVVCQGAEGWQASVAADKKYADVPTIYYLNEKTLVAENVLTVTEYDDFKPTHLVIPSQGASGVAYPLLCENGNVYEFSSTEGALAKPTKLQSNYAQTCLGHDDGSGFSYELVFWDKSVGALCEIYSGYGPYYCSETYHMTRDKVNEANNNYFKNLNIVKLVRIERTSRQMNERSQMLVLSKNAFATRRVVMNTGFWAYDNTTKSNKLDSESNDNVGIGTDILNENTPCVANLTYRSMLFADGNKVRRWYYSSTAIDLHTAPTLQTFGSSSAVVTDLVLSADHKTTYVAFYEPTQTGKNGSIYVIDTDSGEILERHDKVCYKPVKMIYKKK